MAKEVTIIAHHKGRETKLPKITYPRTSDGFQKKIEKMQNAGIKTREDAYKYVMLNLKAIEFEMGRVMEHKDNPMIAGLIERYDHLKAKWEKRLQYTIENINKPIDE